VSDIRIEIGFTGGGSCITTLGSEEWGQLQASITSNRGEWLTLAAKDDEQLVVNTAQIVFVRVNEVLRNMGFASVT